METKVENLRLRIRSRMNNYNDYSGAPEIVGMSEKEERLVMSRLVGPVPEEAKLSDEELTTDAIRTEADGVVRITYAESELTGMEGTVTTLIYRPDDPTLFSIDRSGTFTSLVVLEHRKVHDSVYEVPGGVIEMKVHTLEMENRLEQDGVLTAKYVLRIRGVTALINQIRIEILRRKDDE